MSWMQLGSRAFIAGTSQRRRGELSEESRDRDREGVARRSSVGSTGSLASIVEAGRRLLQIPSTLNIEEAAVEQTELELASLAEEEERRRQRGCLFLTNPTVNDLMHIIHSATADRELKRVIVVRSNQLEHELATALGAESQSEMRRGESAKSKVEFDLIDKERLAIGQTQRQHQELPDCQCLKWTHHLRSVAKPRVRRSYMRGYPMFYNRRLSLNIKESMATKPPPRASGAPRRPSADSTLQRTVSADDVRSEALQSTQSLDSTLRVKSEGELNSMPGIIDSKLCEQMALLKPLYEQGSTQSEGTQSLANDLRAAAELESFTGMQLQDGVAAHQMANQMCHCGLCANDEEMDLSVSVSASASMAKQLVDEAVRAVTKPASQPLAVPGAPEAAPPQPQPLLGSTYLINLAHLILVIACLRGFI